VIDTHCHLLAGLDDGPRSFGDSVRMARRLSEEGVTHVVCTPHFNTRYAVPLAAAAAALDRLSSALQALEVPLTLRLAAELGPAAACAAPADDVRARRLAPGYALVELEPATTREQVGQIEARLAELQLKPVFAHPERCRAVGRRPELLDGPRSRGALVQVVAPSLGGEARSEVGRAAWTMLEDGRVDLVASDAHRPDGSRLRLRALFHVLGGRFGEETAGRLLIDAPARLLGVPRRAE